MARNNFDGTCYQCGRKVAAGTGHFERHNHRWRVKHANVPGRGRVTCEMAKMQAENEAKEAAE